MSPEELMNSNPKSGWISVKDQLPEEDELVWLYSENEKTVFLGCRTYLNNEGWFWSAIEEGTYIHNGKITAGCSIDDWDVTHWIPLPDLPKK